jgi:hypothetical protein
MSSPPETDPLESAPKPWKRWLPLAIAAAVVGTVIAIIVISSGGDDKTASDTTNTVSQSVAPNGSAATTSNSTAQTGQTTQTGPVSSAASSTTLSPGGPTTTAAQTGTTVSSPAVTNSTVLNGATTLPTPAAPRIDLGSASDFAVLGHTGVDSTGPAALTGQVGASNGAVTGLTSAGNPTGVIVASPQSAGQAQLAVDAATTEIDGLTSTNLPGTQLVAQTISPGTYRSATLGVTGTVTLDAGGDPNALFVFESSGTLDIAAASKVVLQGGAQACNVFWRVGSSATLSSGATFVGSVIADDSITAASGSDVVGRLISRNGAVTLDSASITVSTCA